MTSNNKNTGIDIQENTSPVPPSSIEEMDNAISILRDHRDKWQELSLTEKIDILDESIREFGTILDRWVNLNLQAKSAANDLYAQGMEWIGGPVVILRYLQGLKRALSDIHKSGTPQFSGPVTTRPNGQVVAQIYPSSLYERIVTPGVTAEIWMEPGVQVAELKSTQAVAYQGGKKPGKTVLVLGAGNVAGIPVNDTLYKLFVENQVVLLKMSPVNEYLGPLIEKTFHRLISNGYLRIVYGGPQEGHYLCHHPGIDEIHMTGSDKTFDAIVFGGGDEGRKQKEKKQPLITKRFTSELGNVAPAIIVPGPWSPADLEYQAEQIVSHLTDVAGFSCSRTRVILTHQNWPQKAVFLDHVRNVMATVPLRTAFYPGAKNLYQHFVDAHPSAEKFGKPNENQLPWTLIAGTDPANKDDICFTQESFCPVIAETSLEANNIPEFIDHAVEFANATLWGTLSATIIVHPQSLRDSKVAQAVERAIENLRAGVVVINGVPSMAWAMATPPWGSFPGNDIHDIQSGAGHTHNVFMFSRPEKTVVRVPFRMMPKPIWFNSQKRVYADVTKKVAHYDLKPAWWKIPGIVIAALKKP